jgi:hypothetical protein
MSIKIFKPACLFLPQDNSTSSEPTNIVSRSEPLPDSERAAISRDPVRTDSERAAVPTLLQPARSNLERDTIALIPVPT